MLNLFSSIENLWNVGEAKKKAYNKLGIETPYDLLMHFPRKYEDFTHPVNIADVVLDETNVICVTVDAKLSPIVKNHITIYRALVSDMTGQITLIIYNQPYLFQKLIKGMTYFMEGKVNTFGDRLQILSPKIITGEDGNMILPVYKLSKGLSMNQVRVNVKQSLELMEKTDFTDWMPEDICKKYNLTDIQSAIKLVHFPQSQEDIQISRNRLAFDESFELQLGMLGMKNSTRNTTSYNISKSTDVEFFIASLPFTLTDGQLKAIREIQHDMEQTTPMNRLLQGDVGSGKTVVAAAACYMAYKNNMQSVLMAPTEILAVQHFNTLSGFLSKFGVKITLLVASLKAKEKREVYDKIKSGEADIIVGTNAVMQKKAEYKNLGLVITDEQHRFGVRQRNALAEKGKFPHKLVMSATPIPRTLALMMYGELELSVIKEMPKGRKPIQTFAVTGRLRRRAYGFLAKQLDEGRQGYVICSLIEESDAMDDKKSVTTYTQNLRSAMPGYKIDMLHGRMTGEEKDEIMERFKNGDIQVLVSTTVVEVGVDVPNATVMIIEDAERFGMSQLHQLRGRVGRGEYQSYCILITDKLNDETRKRLRTLSSTNDGFKIAEEDLAQRGAGDFFGDRQHGLPPLKIADLSKDLSLFEETKTAAANLLEDDPDLMKPEHRQLRLEVMKMFATTEGGLD